MGFYIIFTKVVLYNIPLLFEFSYNKICSEHIVSIELSVDTFSFTSKTETFISHSRANNKIKEVYYGDVKSTLFHFSDGDRRFCLLTSPFGIERNYLHNGCKKELSQILDLPIDPIVEWSRKVVNIPILKVPPIGDLKADFASIDDFIRFGETGDEDIYGCLGINVSKALSPIYSVKLIDLDRPWHV